MANYSIKDLENFTGIKAHTIRIWEKRYNIIEPKRTCTNIRTYSDEDLKKLLNVSILNRHGIKISNIVNLTDDTISEKILNLSNSQNGAASQIENLVVAMIEMDENKFEKIFNTAVINLGFEEAVIKIMYPFFEKIGILWQIGTINPAHEHFISNLIRQKLIVAIDGLISAPVSNDKLFLLYLPEGEFHELGLLFYYYLIKKAGHKVIYLGQTVPIEGVREAIKLKKVDYIVTAFVTALNENEYTDYLINLSEGFKVRQIFVSGLQTNSFNSKLPEIIKVVRNIADFKKELTQIEKVKKFIPFQ